MVVCGLGRGRRWIGGLGKQSGERLQGTRGRSHLRLDRLLGTATEGGALVVVVQQLHKHKRQLSHTDDPHRIPALEQRYDVAKVLGVIASYDGNSVLRGLDDVVSAARDQAATHEGEIGEAIECGQLSDRIKQEG